MVSTRFSRFGMGSHLTLPLIVLSALSLLLTLAACSSAGSATSGATGTNTPSAGGAGGAGVGAGPAGPRLQFKETEHDFGPISHSTPMTYSFALTNTGSAPLRIGDIKAEPIDPASCA